MKIKSHKLNWAMALCAVATFSFTAARDAQARILPGPIPPIITVDPPTPLPPRPEPVPPIGPKKGGKGAVMTGTFSGTVIGD